MAKTVKVSDDDWKVLSKLKIDLEKRSVGEVIHYLVESVGVKTK